MRWGSLGILILVSFVSGCGYTLQNSKNDLIEKEGIKKLYVKPVVNNTYKPGIENVVYNHILKTLKTHHQFEVVQNYNDADATLEGFVALALSKSNGRIPESRFTPLNFGGDDYVTNEYLAELDCTFKLEKKKNILTKKTPSHILFNSTFTRSKTYPAQQGIGVLGRTAPLINESQFDRALDDLAESMMEEVHETMVENF